MEMENLRIVLGVLFTVLLYVGIPTAFFVRLYRHPEWWMGRYPEWVYGMDTRLRLYVKRAIVVNFLMLGVIGFVSRSDLPIASRLAVAMLVAMLLAAVAFHGLGARRRAFERTVDEGVEVVARIRSDREETLGHPRYLGGAELAAHAAMAFGAALIWRGQWTMEIEFDVAGQTVVDRRHVSSQTYYRFASGDTMPIWVRADEPKAWVPILGGLPQRDASPAPSA